MPTSVLEGKPWMRRVLSQIYPTRYVLDVGPGVGTYGRLLHEARVVPQLLVGLEIFAPYVERYRLDRWYTDVVVGDVRQYDWDADERPEVVIFGDVLEHMAKPDAVEVVHRAVAAADHVLVSLPIIVWEQGACEGNEHEAHLHHWDDVQMREEFGPYIVDSHLAPPVGCYWLTTQR